MPHNYTGKNCVKISGKFCIFPQQIFLTIVASVVHWNCTGVRVGMLDLKNQQYFHFSLVVAKPFYVREGTLETGRGGAL